MCGRYSFWADKNKLLTQFGLDDAPEYRTSYNMAPSQEIPVVRLGDRGRELVNCHWGLIPHWAKEPTYKPINARAETVDTNAFFRDSFRHRRCLIPANGFYEWRKTGDGKQPYFIRVTGRELFAFAGLWENWPRGGIDTAAIVTTTANDTLKPIHARMPVIIAEGDYEEWLADGNTDLLRPSPLDMEAYPVGTLVNNPRNDNPELLEPI